MPWALDPRHEEDSLFILIESDWRIYEEDMGGEPWQMASQAKVQALVREAAQRAAEEAERGSAGHFGQSGGSGASSAAEWLGNAAAAAAASSSDAGAAQGASGPRSSEGGAVLSPAPPLTHEHFRALTTP